MALSNKHTIPSSSGFRHILSSPDYKFNKGNFLIFARQNNENKARLGVSVRKRDYKLATHRNKIKRRLRNIINEAVKKISLNFNYSYLVIAKITMLNNKYTIIKDTLFADFKRIK